MLVYFFFVKKIIKISVSCLSSIADGMVYIFQAGEKKKGKRVKCLFLAENGKNNFQFFFFVHFLYFHIKFMMYKKKYWLRKTIYSGEFN